ncbi:hypothetical protein EML15_08050 [Corynebacterium sp. sy017]|uniref:hypothetical protein n=1 Tax=unclassified Corynebacterium TaxID=2624378 RepID=UPI001184D6F9|nr:MULTISPECIES: hypothetical protein [unclassified Corynebacterium]MBP3089095.1 hypothetical protein [Corynebacterium sp. sy017]TSD91409.1 hypothetical protein ELY17_08060 [Corynebacterium sp. SY003]
MKRYNVVMGMTLSMALIFSSVGVVSAAPSGTSVAMQNLSVESSDSSSLMSDAELDRLIQVLDRVSKNLKEANPEAIPDYEDQLAQELNRLLRPSEGVAFRSSWLQCGAEIASVVVQYGIPVAKVLKWLRDARRMWGSVYGIWRAIKRGDAFAEIGEEGVQVLEMILGFDGVISACFS